MSKSIDEMTADELRGECRKVHALLDEAGIPSAVFVVCRDSNCTSQLVHRVRDACKRLREPDAQIGRRFRELVMSLPVAEARP